MQVQYRNCNYIGGFQEYRRHGFGLLIFDNSNIILAKWNQDVIDGQYAYISDKINAFGTMNMGKLSGYNVLAFKQSPIGRQNSGGNIISTSKGSQQRAIFSMFKDDRPYGKFVLIKNGEATLGQHVQGQIHQLNTHKATYHRDIIDLLKSNFPNQAYKIHHHIQNILAEAQRQSYSPQLQKYIPIINFCENNLKFYGYVQINRKNKNIGFIMNQNGEIITIGQHDGIFLQGLGRAYKSDVVEDGVFKGGVLNGIGVRYNCALHRYQLGEYGRGEGFEKGFGFPFRQVSEIRKQFHLRAIQFFNDIVVFSLGTLFEALIQGTVQAISQKQSPRFTASKNKDQNINHKRSRGFGDNSPLKSKLQQYQYQSDQMQDPIQNHLNSYDRSQFKGKSVSRHLEQHSKKFESDYEDMKDERINTNYREDRIREDDDRNLRRKKSNKSFKKRQDEQRSTRSGRKFKDTKQLVKKLDEQERGRRTYLDQIYKQAKLYSKERR